VKGAEIGELRNESPPETTRMALNWHLKGRRTLLHLSPNLSRSGCGAVENEVLKKQVNGNTCLIFETVVYHMPTEVKPSHFKHIAAAAPHPGIIAGERQFSNFHGFPASALPWVATRHHPARLIWGGLGQGLLWFSKHETFGTLCRCDKQVMQTKINSARLTTTREWDLMGSLACCDTLSPHCSSPFAKWVMHSWHAFRWSVVRNSVCQSLILAISATPTHTYPSQLLFSPLSSCGFTFIDVQHSPKTSIQGTISPMSYSTFFIRPCHTLKYPAVTHT